MTNPNLSNAAIATCLLAPRSHLCTDAKYPLTALKKEFYDKQKKVRANSVTIPSHRTFRFELHPSAIQHPAEILHNLLSLMLRETSSYPHLSISREGSNRLPAPQLHELGPLTALTMLPRPSAPSRTNLPSHSLRLRLDPARGPRIHFLREHIFPMNNTHHHLYDQHWRPIKDINEDLLLHQKSIITLRELDDAEHASEYDESCGKKQELEESLPRAFVVLDRGGADEVGGVGSYTSEENEGYGEEDSEEDELEDETDHLICCQYKRLENFFSQSEDVTKDDLPRYSAPTSRYQA